MRDLKQIAAEIAKSAVNQVKPEILLQKQLLNYKFPEKTFLLALGKAAWGMAKTVKTGFGDNISQGIVLTNYGNSRGKISDLDIYEAGHPYPDENSLKYTEVIIKSISHLSPDEHLLVLLSGGGSALLEKPLDGLTLKDLNSITRSLMEAGADIYEINTVRKHLSAVKGGRLAQMTSTDVDTLILSDVMGDDLAVIASGPFSPDPSTSDEALNILQKYKIRITAPVEKAIQRETPFEISQVNHSIIGNNRQLCEKAAEIAEKKGFSPYLFPAHLQGNALEMGKKIGRICTRIRDEELILMQPCAVILGGETTVRVQGGGTGGRNLEMLLAAAEEIKGMKNIAVCALASDGIDGNSPAAGGVIDGYTYQNFVKAGEDVKVILAYNDSYSLLKSFDSVIETGPTGTNVNDLVIILLG